MKVVPSEDHDALCRFLEIQSHERVLEIGGGHNPVSRADVVVDIDFDLGIHRDGQRMVSSIAGQHLVKGDVEALPFQDNAFDVILCLHVLEHVCDPAAACREMMRVGARGFIETPRKWTEYYAGHPAHQWLVDDGTGVLVFEAIPYDCSPFLNFALPILWSEPLIQKQVSQENRHIPCVQFAWQDSFVFEVRGNCAGVEKQKLAKRYYNFSRNLLQHLVPPERIIFHAKMAVNLDPKNSEYRRLYAFILALTGEFLRAWQVGGSVSLLFKAAGFKWSTAVAKRYGRQCKRIMTDL